MKPKNKQIIIVTWMLVALVGLFTMRGFSQNFPIQLSTESVPINQRPYVYAGPTGKIWVAYATSTGKLVAGYYFSGAWNQTISYTPSLVIRLDRRVSATVDENERVWFFYSDSGVVPQYNRSIGRIGYFESNQWHQVDTVEIRGSGAPVPYFIPTYDIIRNAGNGVWYMIDQIVYRNNVVTHEMRATHAIGTQIRTSKVVVSDTDLFGFVGSVSTMYDSVLTGFTHTYIIQGNSTHRYTWSRYARGSTQVISGLDSGYYCAGIGCGPGSGEIVSTLSVGGDGQSALLVSKVFSTSTSNNWYRAYLVDNALRRKWANILSHADNDNEIAVSNRNSPIALAWFSRDTLRVKALVNEIWCQTSTNSENVSDSSRRTPSVAVSSDSTAWITYTALKNNVRHVFLARVLPSFVLDPSVTHAEEESGSEVPSAFSLEQNYPNPFNPATKIAFRIPIQSFVELRAYDLLGREVATLANEELKPGSYEKEFVGTGLASGIYLYQIKAGAFLQTRKMLLLR